MLMTPKKFQKLSSDLRSKVINLLITRYSPLNGPTIPVGIAKHFVSETEEFSHWGRLQIMDGGDKIGCQAIGKHRYDSRDNTYVRVSSFPSILQFVHYPDNKKYEATSDAMAESEDAPAEMEVRTHFGELQQIFRIEVPQSPHLHLDHPQTLFLAAIKDCDASFSEDGFWEFKTAGKLTVVDLGTIQCVVGRVYDQGKWVIIDRSGDLAHINIGDGGEVTRWNLHV